MTALRCPTSPPPRALRVPPALGVLILALFWLGCAGPAQQSTQSAPQPPPATPPAPMAMDPARPLGLWQSSFGAVKIEADPTQPPGTLMGVWLYDRAGEEVIGFFTGALRGNVLEFTWHEPSRPEDLIGAGFLVFEPDGNSFAGQWWTADQSRVGDWNGWRVQGQNAAATTTGQDSSGAGVPPPRSY